MCSCYLVSHWANCHDRLLCVRRVGVPSCHACNGSNSSEERNKWEGKPPKTLDVLGRTYTCAGQALRCMAASGC